MLSGKGVGNVLCSFANKENGPRKTNPINPNPLLPGSHAQDKSYLLLFSGEACTAIHLNPTDAEEV